MVADRAYLKGARTGAGLARLRAETARVMAVLGQGGASEVEPAALQPADILLDLYGEDIRARAFVTGEDGAEMMLRPDFTVPIVRLHMESGAPAARYTYCGPVWRRQEAGSMRPREYLQAGVEDFGAADPARADADMLARLRAALGDSVPVDLVTGDMGLILAAIAALDTAEPRKAALRRHLWRPARFQTLLRRFGAGHAALTQARAPLLAAARDGRLAALMAEAGKPVGQRSAADVAERTARLVTEAETPPLDAGAVRHLEEVLAVRGPSTAALAQFRAIATETPGLTPAIDRFEARLDALDAAGIAPDTLPFEASFGRTTLEYYDGFVFGALARNRPDLPPLASGGRYDALTRVLGAGRAMSAVGGIIRPEALLAAGEDAP